MRRAGAVVIVVLAVALRLAYVAATPSYVPSGDPVDYQRHAVSLVREGRYPPAAVGRPGGPTAFRPPGYPYALAAVYELAGVHLRAARVANALLGGLSVALVLGIARALWDPRRALVAGGLAAVYPPLVLMSGALLAENLFVPLVLAATLAVLRARGSSHPIRWAVAAGALASCAALTRTNGIVILLPLLAGLLLAGRPGWRPRALAAGAAVVAAVLVLVPWTIRNERAFGAFVPVSTQSGFAISGEYNPVAATRGPTQAAFRLSQDVPAFRDLFVPPRLDELELDRRLRTRGTAYARHHVRYVAEAVRLNGLRMGESGGDPSFTAGFDAERNATSHTRPLWRFGFWILLALCLLALARRAGRSALREVPVWVWAVPLLLLATTVPIVGNPRYRVAVDPFLVLVASAGLRRAPARAR
jgi:4-amino-4-deoxy-L-arabinose transferase-like glycosyltransferase